VKLTYAFLGFQTLIVSAVAGMAIMMAARSDPASNVVLLSVTLVLSIVLGGVFAVPLRSLARDAIVLGA
jgi:hypothetical protein